MAGGLTAVHENVCMVNDELVAGPDLDGFQPARAIHGRAKDEIPIHVGAVGWKRVRFLGFDDFVRLPELPAGDESRGGREVAWSPLESALLDPSLKEGDLFAGKAELVGKFCWLRLRQPRRHEPRRGHRSNLPGARFCFAVSE